MKLKWKDARVICFKQLCKLGLIILGKAVLEVELCKTRTT